MKRRKAIWGILVSMLVLSACSFSNTNEIKQDNEAVIEESVEESSTTQEPEEIFKPEMPIHAGVWQVEDYGDISYYYDFKDDNSGRRVRFYEGDIEEFTYEVTDGKNLVLHYDDRDEYANYSFGEDGKHLVLTYKDYQQSLSWVSHGTLEDMGGLGLSFTTEDVTPVGCTLKYSQKGGYVSGDITVDQCYCVILYDEDEGNWGFTDYIGDEDQTYTIDKNSSGSLTLDWGRKLGALKPGTYALKFRIRDVRNVGGDWDSFDYRVWFTVPDQNADQPLRNETYGMLDSGDNNNYEDYSSIEPECTYTSEDGTVYGMLPVDRAAGSSYYVFAAYKEGETIPALVNEDPFCGSGGQVTWIDFIDNSNLGFSCLTYNGGDDGMLFRTEDGGKSFTQIEYPSAEVELSDGTIYNPFTIPEKVWSEGAALYMLAGQSPWSGDYYNDELEKHPSGLYVSYDDGISFNYLREQ